MSAFPSPDFATDIQPPLRLWGLSPLELHDVYWQSRGVTVKHGKIDLAPLLGTGLSSDAPACAAAPIPESDLALRIAADTRDAVESSSGGEFAYAIRNTDRAIGARLSGDVARRHGDQGMAHKPITLNLAGAAGVTVTGTLEEGRAAAKTERLAVPAGVSDSEMREVPAEIMNAN